MWCKVDSDSIGLFDHAMSLTVRARFAARVLTAPETLEIAAQTGGVLPGPADVQAALVRLPRGDRLRIVLAVPEARAMLPAESSSADCALALAGSALPVSEIARHIAASERVSAAASDPPRLPGEGVAFLEALHDDVVAARRLRATDSALLEAARAGDDAGLQLALEEGARAEVCHAQHGGTALHLLVAGPAGSWDVGTIGAIIDCLLRAGADINAPAANGSTALHWAAGAGHVAAVDALLTRGASASVRTYTWRRQVFGKGSGRTALHWAAEGGHEDCVRLLVDRASPLLVALPDERGVTPEAAARGEGHSAVAALLSRAAAQPVVGVELSLLDDWSIQVERS